MIDLHVHTKISDNSYTVREIIGMACEKGITHIAITDHDTTMGLNEAILIGHEMKVSIIPGIEISAFDYKNNKRVHILGLFIEPCHPSLERLCAPIEESRNESSYKMVKKLIEIGYVITWEEVKKYAEGSTGVYKQHIMHALLNKGYCSGIYCELYKKLFKSEDSLDSGETALIIPSYADAKDAIKAVREAGGIAVLAHPGQFGNYDSIEEWVKLGLEGLEVYHGSHSVDNVERLLEYAKKYNLVVTGGSDFHGFYGETPTEIGCRELKEECIMELMHRKKKIYL